MEKASKEPTKMLVEYNTTTKEIVNISYSNLTQMTHDMVCYEKPHVSNTCTSIEYDKDALEKPSLYLVNDSGEIVTLEKKTEINIEVSCNKTKDENLGANTYRMNASEGCEITILFKNADNGQSINPVGSLIVSTNRGDLDTREFTLTGSQNGVVTNYSSVNETVRVSIKAKLDLKEANLGTMEIELF